MPLLVLGRSSDTKCGKEEGRNEHALWSQMPPDPGSASVLYRDVTSRNNLLVQKYAFINSTTVPGTILETRILKSLLNCSL